jgi:DNA-binding response OmpR family regulator
LSCAVQAEQIAGPAWDRRPHPPVVPTILVVEHEADLRGVLHTYLTMRGYRVLTAGDAVEAVEAIEYCLPSERPRLVILDMEIPHGGGWPYLYRRTYDPLLAEAPVLAISGREDLGRAADPETGVECLARPFDLQTLARVVQRLCRSGTVPDPCCRHESRCRPHRSETAPAGISF